MDNHTKPNIVYVGYMRSGSTYLRSYFTQHPSIHWTRRAWFFQLESDDEIRKQRYLKFFENEQSASCFIDMYESLSLGYVLKETPQKDYSTSINPEWSAHWAVKLNGRMDGTVISPDHAELARRIKHALPDARILIVLRNQFDWFRSMYLHYLPHFPAGRCFFVDFLSTLEGKAAAYAAAYDRLLESYAACFGKENIHVMILEEIASDEENVLHGLCRFLEVPFFPMDLSEADQNKALSTSYSLVPEEQSALRGLLRKLGLTFRKLSSIRKRPPILSEADEAFIRSFYAVSNYRTSVWLDRDLACWGYPI